MSPAASPETATEIFQRAVRIPPIRIGRPRRPNQAVLDVIFGNMRGPRERQGDFQAMIASCIRRVRRSVYEGLAMPLRAPRRSARPSPS